MKNRVLIALLTSALLLAGCGTNKQEPARDVESNTASSADEKMNETETTVGNSTADFVFSTTDLEGNAVTEAVFSDNQVTMVNIWATYCGPCINEMPHLGELAEEYADKGLAIIGIVVDVLDAKGEISDSQVDTANEIIDTTGAYYTHLLPSYDMYEGILSGVSVVPTTYFIDQQGKIIGQPYLGSMDKVDWSIVFDSILEETAQ